MQVSGMEKKQSLEFERHIFRTLFQARGAATYVRHKRKGQTHLSSAFLHVKKEKNILKIKAVECKCMFCVNDP